MKRAIITVGVGFGDEGKGAMVDFLAREFKADLVIRYCGGRQAGHNVQLPDGRRHTFSQFGAGTLAGDSRRHRTYLGPNVVIDPPAFVREAEHLTELGVSAPTQLLTVHPRCLVATFWHRTLNRLREMSRGEDKHGSCGQGIGEARQLLAGARPGRRLRGGPPRSARSPRQGRSPAITSARVQADATTDAAADNVFQPGLAAGRAAGRRPRAP